MSEFGVALRKARLELVGKRQAIDASIAEIDAMLTKHGEPIEEEEPERARVPSRPPLLMPKIVSDPPPTGSGAAPAQDKPRRKVVNKPDRAALVVGTEVCAAAEFLHEEFATREVGAVVRFRDLVAAYKAARPDVLDAFRVIHAGVERLETHKLLNRSFALEMGAGGRKVRLLHLSCSDPAGLRAWIDTQKRKSEESREREAQRKRARSA